MQSDTELWFWHPMSNYYKMLLVRTLATLETDDITHMEWPACSPDKSYREHLECIRETCYITPASTSHSPGVEKCSTTGMGTNTTIWHWRHYLQYATPSSGLHCWQRWPYTILNLRNQFSDNVYNCIKSDILFNIYLILMTFYLILLFIR